MNIGNNIAALYISEKGRTLAESLKGLYPGITLIRFAKGKTEKVWNEYRGLIFIMAAGIVVRTVAPLLKDKKTDPAVVVLDEEGRHAISLLSGHLGGANERAREIARFLGGDAVITTGSDVSGLTAIDLWAKDNDLLIEDRGNVARIGTRLLNRRRLTVYSEIPIGLPEEFLAAAAPEEADVIITNRMRVCRGALFLRPRNIIVGIGCNKGTSAAEIEHAVKKALDDHKLSFLSVASVATIERKADEPGLRVFSEKNSLGLISFGPEELNGVAGVARSEAAYRATGAVAVSEPSALLAAGAATLLVSKQKIGNVTVTAAEMKRKGGSEMNKKDVKKSGKIYVVGTGPGGIEHLTPSARKAITASDIVVGYGTYVDLIRELLGDKEVFSTGMTQEIERCKKAVELAQKGGTVSVISGGDPGIYAMAGLVFEICKDMACDAPRVNIEVIPGISALNACAARLGAPLMHDFASVSLSDRLTPWELIEKRIEAAAAADFVIVLYNPKSKGRSGHIGRAREIIMRYRLPSTPVGIVKGAMREDERIAVTDLGRMLEHEIDMQTTVIIGNSMTFLWNNLMITPRGYGKKLHG